MTLVLPPGLLLQRWLRHVSAICSMMNMHMLSMNVRFMASTRTERRLGSGLHRRIALEILPSGLDGIVFASWPRSASASGWKTES
jgi:hypothetical protein